MCGIYVYIVCVWCIYVCVCRYMRMLEEDTGCPVL